MIEWVVLLRGVNVGGKNKLPMADLRTAIERHGFEQVRSYIQSGNLRLTTRKKTAGSVSKSVRETILDTFDLDVAVMSLTLERFASAVSAAPFRPVEEKDLHLFFWQLKPKLSSLVALKPLLSQDEEISLGEHAFYLHAPGGIARSKVAVKAEKHLAVPLTARNLRTAHAILDL